LERKIFNIKAIKARGGFFARFVSLNKYTCKVGSFGRIYLEILILIVAFATPYIRAINKWSVSEEFHG
jgi:hypothetical protein